MKRNETNKARAIKQGKKPLVPDLLWREGCVQVGEWAVRNNIELRGHALIWPGFGHMPSHYEKAHKDGTLDMNQALKDIQKWFAEAGELTAATTVEWDVLNEPRSNHDIQDVVGDDIMIKWFHMAKQYFPNHRLFVNEYDIVV
tara:strand:- start:44 stop:472 length:429 start_codon:yes stop_codon:yes gene_type:complete